MGKLECLEPAKVFHYFEEICAIPHGSGNVEQISGYLVDFAARRGLYCVQDEVKNVIIIKEASSGYEEEASVILQGHMDMVAVKDPDCAIDMAREGLDLAVDGDFLYARGTSLGGDDGIAVAYALALLDSDDIPHPRLEVIITVDEETGMDGARAADLSMLKGRTMLNLDNEEEGVLLTSCAGGARVHGRLTVEREQAEGLCIPVHVEGLQGGHSGGEIDKGRANANVLLGRLMQMCRREADIRFLDMNGGCADNAIPASAHAHFYADAAAEQTVLDAVQKLNEMLAREYAITDPGAHIRLETAQKGTWQPFTQDSTGRAALLLYLMPNGIQSMSADIPGLVQTSLNLGILKTRENEVELDYSVRSSLGSEKEMLIDKVCLLLSSQGGTYEVTGSYPAWEFRKESPLRDKMIRIYEKMYGCAPRVEAIHAGLECGLLADKLPGLDCVSIGPDMQDIHTPREKLSISSTARIWEYILEILKK